MSLTKERQPCVITGPAQVWLLGVSMGNIGHTVKSQRQFCALQYVTLTTPPTPNKKEKNNPTSVCHCSVYCKCLTNMDEKMSALRLVSQKSLLTFIKNHH